MYQLQMYLSQMDSEYTGYTIWGVISINKQLMLTVSGQEVEEGGRGYMGEGVKCGGGWKSLQDQHQYWVQTSIGFILWIKESYSLSG